MAGIFDMKRITLILLIGILLLSACGRTALISPTSIPNNSTSTPLPTAIATRTLLPSSTSTSSITPLPTIPTFTPTFDARTVVTVTPVPKAECPKENPSLTPNFPYCDNHGCGDAPYHEPILEFLNSGGTHKAIFKAWSNPPPFPESGGLVSKDLTGDGVPELVFSDSFDGVFIFGCANGKYVVLKNIEQIKYSYEILSTKDLNGDGLPEIIIADRDTGGARALSIYNWLGKSFQSKLSIPWGNQLIDVLIMDAVQEISFQDLDHNGTTEIMIRGGLPHNIDDMASGLPWREETYILEWNGLNYVVANLKYSSPEYRYQAIQDADHQTSLGNYNDALQLYKDALLDDKLDWWSNERKIYESYNALNYFDLIERGYPEASTQTPTPYPTLPTPSPDQTEYPRLAAYAYYRIMLLQFMQNQESDATTVYNTLQQKFDNDQYAHPYIEIATTFWNAYQSTHKMYDGCAAAIQYAAEHPEILTPLGSDYHGWQSHTYVPADMCPFR